MSTQRIIQCIGTTEEDMAHLRLLLRVARTHVRDSWVWGSESRADLVIVDRRRLVGDSAMRRAAQRGVACAQIIDEKEAKPPGLSLRKPFRREAFATLLNMVGRDAGVEQELDTWGDEYVNLDLGHVDLSVLEAEHPGLQGLHARRRAGDTREDVEPKRSDDPPPDLSGLPVTGKPEASVEPERVSATAAPVIVPIGDTDQTRAEDEVDPSASNEVEADVDQDATYPLNYYLEKGVLRGPARITVRGLPTLLVDPEAQLFWAKGLLPALEPYARRPLRYGDWQRLSRAELAEARKGVAAKPFARLIWMDSFVRSNGFLCKHFDPGGSYRLTNRLDLSLDYPRAFRVSSLMTVPRKLHEIARITSVGLAEVFDIINAYDTLGYLEWTHRERAPGQ